MATALKARVRAEALAKGGMKEGENSAYEQLL
jgi:hypothetical protein